MEAKAGVDQRPTASRWIDGITQFLGTPVSVGAAISIVALWAIGGVVFGFTDAYQLIINTGTTIITFIMVFAIQHTQNRESRAVNLKLDELLRQTGADPRIVGAEDEPERLLKRQQEEEREMARRADGHASNGGRRGRSRSATRR
ncbi:MAG TPA: low affinity iron permease family protein [Candidatus Dormibacteraeota bacterium]|nr:low affinity iron permease family protein [Candidatus Dormibacteraeota bacterium]